MFKKENRINTFKGIGLVVLLAVLSSYFATFRFFAHLGISPLIIGIGVGMIFANTLRPKMPKTWTAGVIFCTKTILRLGIILYGFRITFQNIEEVGIKGVVISVLVVGSTFIIDYIVGTKVLKLDRDITILTSAGSSICGAAAVLATEPVINSEPHKSAIAVSTVVVFGTLTMFLYPALYTAGVIPFTPTEMGMYIGGTIHEVAHAVGAGNALGAEAAKGAVIVKMIRVMLLAPFLVILGFWLMRSGANAVGKKKSKITIPWFAVYFIVVAGFNSLSLLPLPLVENINIFDTFLLTMAMTALGMETSIDKFKNVGVKPLYLATILFFWLVFGGFGIVKAVLVV